MNKELCNYCEGIGTIRDGYGDPSACSGCDGTGYQDSTEMFYEDEAIKVNEKVSIMISKNGHLCITQKENAFRGEVQLKPETFKKIIEIYNNKLRKILFENKK